MFTADFVVTVAQHTAGTIRSHAVTSATREAAVPELPTVNEALGLNAQPQTRGCQWAGACFSVAVFQL